MDHWLAVRREDQVLRNQMDTLTEIGQHRHSILDRHGEKPLEIDLAEIIIQMREERDDELFTSAVGNRR